MKPWTMHRFTSGQMDVERINDNLEKRASDINASMSRRYTYSTSVFPLEGLANTDTAAQRTFRIRREVAARRLEIAFVELVIYSAAGAVWTLSCSDTSWPSISLDTVDATTEVRAVSNSRVQVASGNGIDFVVSGDSASTITQGYLVVTFRGDRGSQGDTFTPYTPTLLSAASSTAGSVLDAELVAAAAAADDDKDATQDLRIETFRVRGLASGSAVSWVLPSGARRLAGVHLVNVGANPSTLTLNINGIATATAAGAGTSTITSTVADVSGVFVINDDPMDTADDTTVELAASVGTVSIGYVSLYWT